MAVVVDHRDAVHLALDLIAPIGAMELRKCRRQSLERHLQFEADRHRRQRVLQVVQAWDADRQLTMRRHATATATVGGRLRSAHVRIFREPVRDHATRQARIARTCGSSMHATTAP